MKPKKTFMNANYTKLNNFIGAMYGTIVGGYQAEVAALGGPCQGNIAALMNDFSTAQSIKNLLPLGTTATVACDLVGRLLGTLSKNKRQRCMTASQQDGWAIKLIKDANLRLAMKEVLIEERRGIDARRPG